MNDKTPPRLLPELDGAGSVLGMCVLLSSVGCQNNTIELEFPSDGSTSGPATGSDTSADSSTSSPTTTGVTTAATTTPGTATTTGLPPVQEVCTGYAQILDECYGVYYDDAYSSCLSTIEIVTLNYGEACGLLYQEYLACLSNLSCEELMAGNQCGELFEQFQLECP